MTDENPSAAPSIDDCADAIIQVQAFLHGEMPDSEADEIRQHLMTCEQCLEFYDSETLITELVRRSYQNTSQPAPDELRARIAKLRVSADAESC